MKAILLLYCIQLSVLFCNPLAYSQSYNAGLDSGTKGVNSVHIGPYAGRISTGSFNSFLGFAAGLGNTTGNNNSFLGYGAGNNNTYGSFNSFIGSYAGLGNTTGQYNIFLGYRAGYTNSTGTYNSFIGSQAGYNNTSGGLNSFMGLNAGFKNTTGGYNTFVGANAGFTNNTGSRNLFLGYQAGYYNTTGNENSFVGDDVALVNTTGSKNTALGYLSGPTSNNLSNATAIGHRARVSVSNAMVLGSINGVNGATADVKVGIRTNSPAYNLHVNGTVAKPGGGSWTAASDKRLKHQIKDFTEGLAIIKQIRPVTFSYNGKAGLPTEKEYVGVIAQEIKQIAPYMIGEFTYTDTTGSQEKYLDYDGTALTYILVNAVKELKQENEALKNQVAEVESLKQELAAMKELLIKYIPEAGNSQARLWQNTPNPYTGSTTISYQVPLTARNAFIKVYSSTGVEVKSFDLTGKPQGEVTLWGGMLSAGSYVYTLFVDGVKIDTKKFVLTR